MPAALLSLPKAFYELTKPRLTALVLLTTAAGFWMGCIGTVLWTDLASVILGTALVAGGANALNQWMERSQDALMKRTQLRPLPSQRLDPRGAHIFGWALVVGGALFLDIRVNSLAALLAVLSAVSYVHLYTPLKRVTPWCTLVGTIPGALPVMIGWSSARGQLGFEPGILFAILVLWQMPHFLALAVLFREEYAAAGFKIITLNDVGGRITARQIFVYTLALIPVSLIPSGIGMTGVLYLIGAWFLGMGFMAIALLAAKRKTRADCRRLFLASIGYLPLLLVLMVFDKQ